MASADVSGVLICMHLLQSVCFTNYSSVAPILPLQNLQDTYLGAGLSCAVGAHKLHKLLKRVLVMVAYGGMGEVRTGLLDDGGGREVQG